MDTDCIWKDPCKRVEDEVDNLIDKYRFNHAIISKIILPWESAREHVNVFSRFCLYKIQKRTKVNIVHLDWDYLVNFLKNQYGKLPFGSLISIILVEKKFLKPYLESFLPIEEDIIEPTGFKLTNVRKMRIP
jgi:hypothetical protein